MSFTVLIPARLASTRLPDKPLADIGGVPMVVRVAQQARKSSAQRIVVATDHQKIVDACKSHQVDVVLTQTSHPTGSDRLAEACALLNLDGDDLVVNVQGDEPLIDPNLINAVAEQLSTQADCVMSTAAHPLEQADHFSNPNVVKVVLDKFGRALYFSRASIPWWRDAPEKGAPADGLGSPLRHVGIYGYRAGFLRRYPSLEASPLESVESLEQLRVLWHGEKIAVHITPNAPGAGVDTPEDLAIVRALFSANTHS